MSFLLVNGVRFPLTRLDAEEVRAGDVERSASLQVRNTARASAWDVRGATGLLSQEEARVVRGLLQGEGHVLSFDSTTTPTSYQWSSRALVLYDAEGDYERRAGLSKWGPASLRFGDGGGYLSWVVGVTPAWTCLAWISVDGEPFQHLLVRSDGQYRVDGGLSGSIGSEDPFFYCHVQDGRLRLTSPGGLPYAFDDVVLLPYLLPDAWLAPTYAWHSTRPWPPLPYVWVGGEGVPGGAREAQGRAGTVQRTVGGPGGTWRESFDFTLYLEPEE